MVQTLIPPSQVVSPVIYWEKLPDDFILPDDPVDNINQPTLAAALTDSLYNAGKLTESSLTTTNYGICARLDNHFVVKAPDWAYIPQITVPRQEVERSYTPHLQGHLPEIVMEFLSETEGGEYSSKPTYPPGKWFFYEKIIKVPYYIIFDFETAHLEVYKLDNSGQYKLESAIASGRYWIEGLNLYLGVWQGLRENHRKSWLRWWSEQDELLLWGSELAEQERQRADLEQQRANSEQQRADSEQQRADLEQQRANSEQQRADSEFQRAERLATMLRNQGIDPDTL
ncbi:MAG: Uma2 family endonuclease [Microcystaceae cyanobacterium]